MKRFLVLALTAAALAVPSYAEAKPKALNCGWPHPDPACAARPPAAPVAPAPSVTGFSVTVDPTDTGGIIGALVDVKGTFVNDLTAVATMAATPNPITGASWDPPALWCMNGTPAQGTQGQPGYIPAYAGLIAWVSGVSLPANTMATVPAIPDGGGVAATAEEVWLKALAAYQDVNPVINSIVGNLTNMGPPESVMKPCGALIQDRIQTVQNAILTTTSQLTLFNGILAAYLPKVALVKHARMVHAKL